MPKFRKNVVIEAEQYTNVGPDPVGVFRRDEDLSPYVVTIHDQRCYLTPGDWIIPEPDGVHFYPCKPDKDDSSKPMGYEKDHTPEPPHDPN